MSTNRIKDKEDIVHISSGILHSHKKEGNNTTGSNMDGPGHYHTKWRKSDRERQIWYQWSHLQNRNRCIDIKNKLMGTKGKHGGRDKSGVGMSIYTLLHKKQTVNKDLLYGTWNSICNILWQPVREKNLGKKEYVYMSMWITLLYTWN